MRGRSIILPALVALAVLAGGVLASEHRDADQYAEALETYAAALNGTLERLVVLFEQSAARQEAEFLLRVIEMKERRMRPAESELRGIREDLRYMGTTLLDLENMLEAHNSALHDQIQEGLDTPTSDTRMLIGQVEREIEQMERRIAESERRTIELENNLMRGRREMEILDERLELFLQE